MSDPEPSANETRTDGGPREANSDGGATLSSGAEPSAEAASFGLQVRCPQCQESFSVAGDTNLTELTCLACHRTFSLIGAESDSAKSPSLARIAHFELLSRVGMGGIGTVWRARDTRLDRIVAVKVPRKEQLDPHDVEKFLHEARIAARLSHPNIVKIFEVGRDGDAVYLVSEFMEGETLRQWASERQLTPTQCVELMLKILRALAHAHAAGVIHRDLKPQNVLMDERDEPHITDFGLAKRVASDATHTVDGKVMGTPAYMSPEQARGAASATDHRTDLYSMGVLFFQLLTDELPFRGNIQRLIYHVIHDDPPRLRDLDPDVPIDLETICLKLLEKDPNLRYGSADEVSAELERFLRGVPILARPVGLAERMARWAKRHPAIPALFATLAAVMLVVSVATWRWYRAAAERTERALTAQALRGVGFAADSVSHNATRELDEEYRVVEGLAATTDLLAPYFDLIDDPELAPLCDELNDERLEPARRDALRRRLMEHPAQRGVQAALRSVASKRGEVFGWFVMRADGLQVARWPVNDTIGSNYSWRTYFHGGAKDYADRDEYEATGRTPIERTHLSAAFVSQVSDRWVVAISTPLRRPASHPEAGKFAGIVALMFEVGEITELPGDDRESEFAVLVDARPGSEGMILRHPLYEHFLARRAERLPDRFQQLRVELTSWRPGTTPDVEVMADYRDPLAADPLGEVYDQRWLAAKCPVRVRGQPTGLEVIVQQSYRESIGDGLERLDRQVRLLLIASLGLELALVVPLWSLVLRRLGGP